MVISATRQGYQNLSPSLAQAARCRTSTQYCLVSQCLSDSDRHGPQQHASRAACMQFVVQDLPLPCCVGTTHSVISWLCCFFLVCSFQRPCGRLPICTSALCALSDRLQVQSIRDSESSEVNARAKLEALKEAEAKKKAAEAEAKATEQVAAKAAQPTATGAKRP